MTFRKGWLERQLQTASKTVDNWPTTKREALALNREGYSCGVQSEPQQTRSEQVNNVKRNAHE